MKDFRFPTWTNRLVKVLLIGTPIAVAYGAIVLMAGVAPETTHIGYAPEQPVPFSHKLHAGKLKMDWRYCPSVFSSANPVNR